MSKHRKQRKSFFAASLSVVALGAAALSASVPQVANAYTAASCPAGWTFAENSSYSALDGIYCDIATVTDVSLVIPTGITEVLYLTVGGGGGGADGHVSGGVVYAGGGGGAGQLSSGSIDVTPGDTFVVQFSSGGAAANDSDGQDGSDVSYKINAGSSVVLSEGGGGGLKAGAGGAAGGASGFAGGAGSSTPNSVAGGGGGGWAFAGEAGVATPEAAAGWGGAGIYYDPDTDYGVFPVLPIDEHWNPYMPGGREALDYSYVIPSGKAATFYDYMGIGGPGGVAVQGSGGEDPNVTCERAVGHYLEGNITVAEKGLGTCYEISNTYYATTPVTPEHPGMGGVGGTGTAHGTNGQGGLAYLRIYVPHVYDYNLSASQTTIAADDTVIFSYDAPDRSAIALFVDGTYLAGNPAWNTGSLTGSDVWDYFGDTIGGDCREVVLQARLYSTSVVEAVYDPDTYTFTLNLVGSSALPDANTAFLDSVDVTVSADACTSGGGSGDSGSGSRDPRKKPDVPTKQQVTVTAGAGSLSVAVAYDGDYLSAPTIYQVSVSPGGNSCVAYGEVSSCVVSGLKVGVEYTVSIIASNDIGSSFNYLSAQKYVLTESGFVSYSAKKTIDNFAGDSPRLLKALKLKIRKFLTKHADLTSFTCTGYTAGPVTASDKVLANTRAANVCAYIQKVKPSVLTTTIGKTPGLPWGAANRKVVIKGFASAS